MRIPTIPSACLLFLVIALVWISGQQAAGNSESSFNMDRSLVPQKVKPSPTPDIAVTAAISDFLDVPDIGGGTQRIWMQIRSDGAGTYTNSPDVESIIQSGWGNWYLTELTSARHLFLDLSRPIPGSGPNGGAPVAPFSAALITARLVAKCDNYNNHMLTIPAGTTVNCPLSVLFSISGSDYQLQMNPVAGAYVFPHTDYVDVTCNAAANAKCNSWTIKSNGSKGGCLTADCSVKQNVARLSKMVTARGRTTAISQGDFYLTFSIGVTNP